MISIPIASFKFNIEVFMKFRERCREQAAKNALTLLFMAVGFIVTWLFILVATFWAVSHG